LSFLPHEKYKQPAPLSVFLIGVRAQFSDQEKIPWCVAKCLTEGWWRYSETNEIALLWNKQT